MFGPGAKTRAEVGLTLGTGGDEKKADEGDGYGSVSPQLPIAAISDLLASGNS